MVGTDVARGAPSQLQGQLATSLVVVGPVDQTVLAHDQTFYFRVLARCFLHHQSPVKSGSLPSYPAYVVAVDFLCQSFPVLAGGDGDHGVRMGVVHVRLER